MGVEIPSTLLDFDGLVEAETGGNWDSELGSTEWNDLVNYVSEVSDLQDPLFDSEEV